MYCERLLRAASVLSTTPRHTRKVAHCAIRPIHACRFDGVIGTRNSGADSGKSPTGPLIRVAATTESPAMTPPTTAANSPPPSPPQTTAVRAAVVNNDTVVSRRFPTIAHDTTGTAVQSRTGSHSKRWAADAAFSRRQTSAISAAVENATATEYSRSTYQ